MDEDIESGRSKNNRKTKRNKKKKQDYRNKLEDWQRCSVSIS